MASRSNSYKMKASTMDKREKRVLRVHRRSIDQREMRLDEVNKRRNLDNLTPVLESKEGSKQTSRIGTPSTSNNQNAALSRLDKLKKWKEERELRKKLVSMESARNKPGFKISHLTHQDNVLYKKDTSSSSKPSQFNGKPQRVVQPKPHQPASIKKPEAKPASTTKSVFVRKLTDSVKQPEPAKVEATVKKPELITKRAVSANLSGNTQPVRKSDVSSPKTLKKLPSKEKVNLPRGGRAHFMAPTAASKTRVSNARSVEKPKLATDTKKPAKNGVLQSSTKVSTHRGNLVEMGEPSFAPNDFIFEAPSSVPSFVFKPLSPASAAGFLFPNGNSSSTMFSAFNDDVGRTSTPKKTSASMFQQEHGEGSDEMMPPTTNTICDNEVVKQDTLETEEQKNESNACKGAKSPAIVTNEDRAWLTACNKNSDFPDEANIKELSAIRRETFDKAMGELPMSTEKKAAVQVPSAALTSDSGMGLSANDPETDSPALKAADSSADEENNEVFHPDDDAAVGDAISLKSANEQLADGNHEKNNTEHPSADNSENSKESNNQFPAADNGSLSLPVSDIEVRTTRSRSRSFGALRPSSKKDLIIDESFKPLHDSSLRSRRSVARANKLESRSVEDHGKENVLVQSVLIEGTDPLDTKQYENQQPSTDLTPVQMELLDMEADVSGKQSKKQQLVLDQSNTGLMRKTPLRRSSRLVARAETESTNDNDDQSGATKEKESTPLLRLHRSHRLSVPKTFLDAEGDTSHMETLKNATPISKRRRSKRLSTAVVDSPIPSLMKELPGEDTPSKSVAVLSTPQCSKTEKEMNEEMDTGCTPGYENDGVKSAYQLRRRRSTTFLTPGPPLSSVKRSKAKRRRTDIMIALASAKSPEEVIKIIATSPMVEMTRRTPKSKLSPEMRRNTTAALFDDDDDLLLQGPLQLFPDTVDAQKPSCSSEEKSEGDVLDKEHKDACMPEKRDVSYFRTLWATEVERLTKLADKWEALGEGISGLCEEVQGEIRTTVCQARLLMKQKLQQFSGLVDSCESGDPHTTCQDLQGFWDMVYMQVEDVDNKFHGLDKLQQNNWKPEEVAFKQGKKAIKKKETAKVVKASGKSKSVSKFAAFKAQLLKQNKATNADTEIPEEKVFDAGFFKVSSPVRTPRHHYEAGTPATVELPVPQSTCDESSQVLTPSSKQTDSRLFRASENKENVAHIFLRRSMGEGHPRHSFSPSVPSPLLQDSTPRRKSVESSGKRLRRSLYQQRSQAEGKSSEKDESSEDSSKSLAGDEALCVKRSTRTRKSVSFVESKNTQSEPVDFMAYLQPSFVTATDSPQQVSSLESSPFSVDSLLVQPDTSVRNTPGSKALSCTPALSVSGGRQRSCLKKLPSVERRKSRRSVSFVASPALSENRSAFPSTPYNRNSLVANTRILRRSAVHSSPQIESPLNELQDLKQMPKLRRSTRPSLLYTPPQQKGSSQQKTPVKDIPVDTLVAFTP